MSNSPFLTFFLVMGVYQVLITILYVLPNRIMRHCNIRKHGYPPAHCDADEGLKKEA